MRFAVASSMDGHWKGGYFFGYVLCFDSSVAAVRGNYFNAVMSELGVELVRIVRVVANQVLGRIRNYHLN
jgi:hypothetical protein